VKGGAGVVESTRARAVDPCGAWASDSGGQRNRLESAAQLVSRVGYG
jgi:hypothetical protein